jgi:hypothetical protein
MKRTRTLLTCAATVCGLALPALAQTAPPPPPATPPAEMQAAPPPAETPPPPPPPVVSLAAVEAVKAADDMTGSIGFGVGVAQNAELLGTTADVAIKYWMHDNLALVPQLDFALRNQSQGVGTTWALVPQLQVLFVPFKSTSTRLEIGGGLGFAIAKTVSGGDTSFAVAIPITAGVEHFFTRWFSMGIAVSENFFTYSHPGNGAPNTTTFTLDSGASGTVLAGSLFFYTD